MLSKFNADNRLIDRETNIFLLRTTPQRQQICQPGRTSSIISNASGSSAPEEFSDDEYDDDDEYDNIDGEFIIIITTLYLILR